MNSLIITLVLIAGFFVVKAKGDVTVAAKTLGSTALQVTTAFKEGFGKGDK